MSGGNACRHQPRARTAVVTMREANQSAFNGYRITPSDYSAVLCLVCGARWRTRAKWVDDCRDATDAERYGA